MIPAACQQLSGLLKKIDAPCRYSKVGACSLLLVETLMLILYHHVVDSILKERKEVVDLCKYSKYSMKAEKEFRFLDKKREVHDK